MTKILILANASSALLRVWMKLTDKNHQIFLISTKQKDKFLQNIEFKRIFVKKSVILSYIKLLIKIRRLMKEIKPDIIISHFTIHHGVIASFAKFHPHIAVVYGSDVFRNKLLFKIINRRVLKKADKIIVSAENTQKYLHSTFNIDEEKIITKSWGINNQLFNTKIRETKDFKTEIFKEMNMDKNGKYILSPRLIRPVYNHKIILEAFALISKKYPDYKLIMMHHILNQTTNYWNQIKSYSRELNITDKIIWSNRYLSSYEMADIFSISDVMINIPKYDQLASTVLEGLSCGCFSIVSNLKPYYEVIKEGYNGFILTNNNPESILEAFDKYNKDKIEYKKNALKHAEEIQEKYQEKYFIDRVRNEIKLLVSKSGK